jgi:CHAT domain-containing protein/Tfp pilus assembly protein PilF
MIPSAGFSQNLSVADSLHKTGMEHYEHGYYAYATTELGKAFHLYKKHSGPSTWVPAGFNYAVALMDHAKYTRALHLLESFKKTAYGKHHRKLRARIENEIGLAYLHKSREQKALKHFNKTLGLAKKSADRKLAGIAYNSIGAISYSRGDYQTSLQYRKKSLAAFQKTQDEKGIAILLNNIGAAYKQLSLGDSALKYYKKSLDIKKKLGDVGLLSTAYNNLANVLTAMGYFNKALTKYQMSLKLGKQTGTPYQIARPLNNIGILYNKLGQNREALSYYKASLQIQKKFSDSKMMAITHKNIGNRLWDLNEQEKALESYQKALSLNKRSGDPRSIAGSLYDLAKVELKASHFSAFSSHMQQAHIITDTLRAPHLLVKRHLLLAKRDSIKNLPFQAIDQLRKAVQQSFKIDSAATIHPLIKLAKAFWPDQPDSAIFYGRESIQTIEAMQHRANSIRRFQAGYFKQYAPFYTEVASWILNQTHNIALAYKLVEMGKSRVLTRELAQKAQFGAASLSEKDRLNQAQQLSEIASLRRQVHHAENDKKRQALENTIRSKQLIYDAFINRLHQQNPRYQFFKKTKAVSLSKVQSICPPKTAILEYALNRGHLLIFLITPKQATAKTFALEGKSTLKKEVLQFYRAILARDDRDSLAKLSKPLFSRFVAPFQAKLHLFQNLLVIPSGFLAYLPFDALIHDHQYLISSYNIQYATSMTGYTLIPKPHSYSFKKLLAIGNSALYPKNLHAPSLAGTTLEVESISRLFPNAMILKGKNLNEKRVRKLLKQRHSVVHIASHSIINEKKPSLSGIVVGKRENGNDIKNDGFLRRSEISRLHIPSNLIVLSACKTAKGKLINGEGMMGLQQAFFVAGVSTVIVSLWDVYDRATALLMKNFYTELKKNHKGRINGWHSFLRWIKQSPTVPFSPATEAMHQAKLKMLHNPEYHDPVFWAPFVVIGR